MFSQPMSTQLDALSISTETDGFRPFLYLKWIFNSQQFFMCVCVCERVQFKSIKYQFEIEQWQLRDMFFFILHWEEYHDKIIRTRILIQS